MSDRSCNRCEFTRMQHVADILHIKLRTWVDHNGWTACAYENEPAHVWFMELPEECRC